MTFLHFLSLGFLFAASSSTLTCNLAASPAFNRSYPIPQRFPFPPIRLVMERSVGACDLYRDVEFCNAFAADTTFEPEFHIREVIASFLDGCHRKRCVAVDVGGNNGWMAAFMLALGAEVLAVEPQADLAQALRQTMELNCWQKGEVWTAFAHWFPQAAGRKPVWGGWRAGGCPVNLRLPSVPVRPLDQILAWKGSQIDFLKIDVDGLDGALLMRIELLLSAGLVTIGTIVIECHHCEAVLMHQLQQAHGYHIYLLDVHIDQRFLNSKGIDVYSSFQDIQLPSFLEEFYSIRFMRHIYFYNPNMTVEDWKIGVNMTRFFENQYVLTKETLLEPRREHPVAIRWPSRVRRTSGYKGSPDGLT